MLKPEQIPAEAVEAARKFMRLQALSDEWIDDLLAAAINAWPGVRVDDTFRWLSEAAVILPMEDKNAES